MSLSARLKKIIENPEDLSDLPKLVEDVAKIETQLTEAEAKIGSLHELNRKYLGMIPIKDVSKPPEEETKQPTPAEAVQEILEKWKG